MRIEIEHKSPAVAASDIKALMNAKGGTWIANAVGGEGFVLARVGSEAGGRLSRSGAAGLCGPFTTYDFVEVIEAKLAAARLAFYEAYGPDFEPPKVPTTGGFVPSHELAYRLLKSAGGGWSIAAIAREIAKSESVVTRSMQRLSQEGRVSRVMQRRGSLYRIAA